MRKNRESLLKTADAEKLLVREETNIRNALSLMSETGRKSLAVVDPGKRLLGTLSDGDVRRAILAGQGLTDSIDGVFYDAPTSVEVGEFSTAQVRDLFIKNRFDIVPVVDKAGLVEEILTWEDVFNEEEKPAKIEENIPVVIMAGGKGTRMEPFTKILPKPLLPVHEKTIIEHIIEKFVSTGTETVYLTVNYKSKVLKAFFEELSPMYEVRFVSEEKPLGTAGSLHTLKDAFSSTFFVTNCDVIVETDYSDIIDFHRQRNNVLTLVASTKNFTVPYGSCELDQSGDLAEIKEKPEYELLVNAGLYVLERQALEHIRPSEFCHMTELIRRLKNSGKRVGVYPISEKAWTDVGEWPEYRKALRAFSS